MAQQRQGGARLRGGAGARSGGLVLPAVACVVALEQEPRVLVWRHHCVGRADALVRLVVVDERHERLRRRCREHDDVEPFVERDAIQLDACSRFDLPERRRDIAQRDVGDLLADELAFGADAQQYLPAVAVQEPAQRLTRALQLRRRALDGEGESLVEIRSGSTYGQER